MPDSAYYDGAQTDVAIEKISELKLSASSRSSSLSATTGRTCRSTRRRNTGICTTETDSLGEEAKSARRRSVDGDQHDAGAAGLLRFPGDAPARPGPLTEEQDRLLQARLLCRVSYIDAQIGRLLDDSEAPGPAGQHDSRSVG